MLAGEAAEARFCRKPRFPLGRFAPICGAPQIGPTPF